MDWFWLQNKPYWQSPCQKSYTKSSDILYERSQKPGKTQKLIGSETKTTQIQVFSVISQKIKVKSVKFKQSKFSFLRFPLNVLWRMVLCLCKKEFLCIPQYTSSIVCCAVGCTNFSRLKYSYFLRLLRLITLIFCGRTSKVIVNEEGLYATRETLFIRVWLS